MALRAGTNRVVNPPLAVGEDAGWHLLAVTLVLAAALLLLAAPPASALLLLLGLAS